MKAEDLGIDVRSGRHNRTLTAVENRFLGILWTDHVGRARLMVGIFCWTFLRDCGLIAFTTE